jgi:polyisoprenoid-binding protein YceI
MRASIRNCLVFSLTAGAAALAAPVTYQVDARHTHPSFEADHFGGVSVWRGGFSASGGTIVLDREAKSGTVDVTIDTTTVLTGVPDLDKHLKTGEFLDVEKFPTAKYKGRLAKFANGAPTEVQGDLTLHGVTKPVVLTIKSFKCKAHPMKQGQELCGADAHGTINREDFGITWGKDFGFDMKVNLAIQVEATTPKK